MEQPIKRTEDYFTPFKESIAASSLPKRFTNPYDYRPHPLCLLASKQLQHHLTTQTEWKHNFGLVEGMDGPVSGKMFGVMVVKTEQNEIGYLAAYSGALAESNDHSHFVPPIFDVRTEGNYLINKAINLTHVNKEVKALEKLNTQEALAKIEVLKEQRKAHSSALSAKIFEQYHFLNQAGGEKSLLAIFQEELNHRPPGGAGDCAAPKLLQYAFQNNMKPLAIAEFFWGLSRGSDIWQHGQYYPACDNKCKPILSHMLKGIEIDEKPEIINPIK